MPKGIKVSGVALRPTQHTDMAAEICFCERLLTLKLSYFSIGKQGSNDGTQNAATIALSTVLPRKQI